MKCSLCKGKKSFLVFKKDNEFNPFIAGTDYYVQEDCPRCKGTGEEEYISSRHIRLQSIFKSYGENYIKYFKSKTTIQSHKDILEYIK